MVAFSLRGNGSKGASRGDSVSKDLGVDKFRPGAFTDYQGSVRDYLEAQYIAYDACCSRSGSLDQFCSAMLAGVARESKDYTDALRMAVESVRQNPKATVAQLVGAMERYYGETESFASVEAAFSKVGEAGFLRQGDLPVARYHAQFVALVRKCESWGDEVTPIRQLATFKRGLNDSLRSFVDQSPTEYKTLDKLVRALTQYESRTKSVPRASTSAPRLAASVAESPERLRGEVAAESRLLYSEVVNTVANPWDVARQSNSSSEEGYDYAP